MAGQTLIYKILRHHLADGNLRRGEECRIRIDQTLCQDATGTMAFLELEAMGVEQVKTELSVQYIDHNTSQFGPENHNDHLYLQSVCAAKGVWFSRPGNGICHQVHLERFGVPGKTLLGSDSHTPTNGGLGMVAIGAGGLDVAVAMAGKPFKMMAPRVIGVCLSGRLRPWVCAKDVILHLLSILSTKGNVGCAIEYFGPGVASLTVPERATITNMGAELGVTTSVFPSDDNTRAFLEAQGREAAWQPCSADPDAEYDRLIEIDLAELKPLAACPSSPDLIKPVAALQDTPVAQVIIGSCTNSSLKDLMLAAEIMRRHKVHPQVSLAIAPGSRQVMRMLADNGGLSALIGSGARILESACGPCIGQGMSPASDEVTVRTFNRNFKGRTGTAHDQCYLTGVESALMAAIHGRMVDPTTCSIQYPEWQMPEAFDTDDSMLIPPPSPAQAQKQKIVRKETVGQPPQCSPFPHELNGEVVIRVGDKTTTDHIMPAGVFLKLRSNIPEYAKEVFNCFNEPGKPTFAERAVSVREAGRQGVIVAGESYGQGSSREHAAICPMHLGVRLVLAVSIERIHAANLINFGILPLLFKAPEDLDKINQGDTVLLPDSPGQLSSGPEVELTVITADHRRFQLSCLHQLSEPDVQTVLAGGLLNLP